MQRVISWSEQMNETGRTVAPDLSHAAGTADTGEALDR